MRVAGNVVAPSIVGSIAFAASTFGTHLVVVMGHSACGAIAATLAARDRREEGLSPNIRDIVERILPAVADPEPGDDAQARMRRAVRANVRASVSQLRHGSRVLEDRCREGLLQVVGAEYDLASGLVHWLG